jgi:hypothetical protein
VFEIRNGLSDEEKSHPESLTSLPEHYFFVKKKIEKIPVYVIWTKKANFP